MSFVQSIDSGHDVDPILGNSAIHPSDLSLAGWVAGKRVFGIIRWQSLHDHGQFPVGGSEGKSATTVFDCHESFPARCSARSADFCWFGDAEVEWAEFSVRVPRLQSLIDVGL